ncbi:hypothetical protein BH10BAC4_BH10BAC4_19590 [soil metagenome]
MRVKYVITAFFFFTVLFAQAAPYTPYQWDEKRNRYSLSEKEEALGEYILKFHDQYEYVLENEKFLMYVTTHRIIRVNNSEAIQRNNRIYISLNDPEDLVDLKARALGKDGKATNFDRSNLKEVKDEESRRTQTIFAMEGVEQGSEIEYYYTRRMKASLFDRAYFQFEIPIKASSFLLTSPAHLKFELKSYNDYPAASLEAGKEINTYHVLMNDVPGLKKEGFSQYNSNRKRVEFKLAYNTSRSQARLYSWEEAAKTFYKILTTITKDDEKALEKFVKELGDNSALPLDKRIYDVERKIKTSIQVQKQRTQESGEIANIIKYKLASEQGMTKLFLAVFEKLKIESQIVITCSRELVKFDGTFDSWSYLDDYLIYFPATKKFLSAETFDTRYPLVPPLLMQQSGLFIEPLVLGELKSGLGTLNEIPAVDYSLNTDDLDISITFLSDLSSNQISLKRKFSGYNARYLGPYSEAMTTEQKSKLVEQIMKQTAPDSKIDKWKAGPLPDNAMSYVIEAEFTTDHFIENAGSRILFKAGELIGPQTEMYREDQRMTPVENDFNRGYERLIRIAIPPGYAVKNPQDFKMLYEYEPGSKNPFLFQSDFTLKGNVLEITIKEYYKQVYAPLSQYENFRKVVNAAADFNKITLVLEKVK